MSKLEAAVVAVELFAANEQDVVAVDLDCWIALGQKVLEAQRISGDVEMNILFVDEEAISALNEQFLGKVGPTDVLSFPIEDETEFTGRSPDQGGSGPGSVPLAAPITLLGDVVICPTIAAANALSHNTSDDDETALLLVHGILHLLGHDHEDDEEAEVMEALERKLLAEHFHATWGAPRL
jgi:probable rRNA maturation factor